MKKLFVLLIALCLLPSISFAYTQHTQKKTTIVKSSPVNIVTPVLVFKPCFVPPPYIVRYSPYGYYPGYVSDIWVYNPYSKINVESSFVSLEFFLTDLILLPFRIIDQVFPY